MIKWLHEKIGLNPKGDDTATVIIEIYSKLIRAEIFVANFIPSENDAGQGSFFLTKM